MGVACQFLNILNTQIHKARLSFICVILQLAQLERAQTRLQDDLARQTENSRVQEGLRESKEQVTQLKAVVEQLRSELSTLENKHSTLR